MFCRLQALRRQQAGCVGLVSFGHTCFLNAVMQCLAHASPIKDVFLSGAYLRDINEDNPDGSKAGILRAFAHVMHHLWQVSNHSCS